MSQLKVNSIVPVGGLLSGASGGIIQTVTAVKTDTASTNSTSFVDTGLEATITPNSNSSKILIICCAIFSGNDDGLRIASGLFRGSTQIFLGDASSNRRRCSWQGTTTDDMTENVSHVFVDSPATTSATTYKLKFANETSSGGYTMFLNRNSRDNDQASHGRCASSITLLELGG